jgi:WD40 repeat protein
MLSPIHKINVFICYRRNDGAWYAEWLNEILSDVESVNSDNVSSRVHIYYDRVAPGVADWKKLHFPSLQTSQVLIIVCTPGIAKDLSKLNSPDWVYEELRWWIKHRNTAPIVVDTTGEGERWLPEIVKKKWPNINRIDLDKTQAEDALKKGNSSFIERIRGRVLGAIQISEKAIRFEDLEHSKKLSRRLTGALWCVVLLLFIVLYAFQQAKTEKKAAVVSLAITQSTIIRNEKPDSIELSVLLALEAYKRSKSTDSKNTLLASLSLLPRDIDTIEHGECGLTERLIFSPKGDCFASSGTDNAVHCWDVKTRKQVFVRKYKDVVLGLAFSMDGKYLAIGSGNANSGFDIDRDRITKDSTAQILSVPSGIAIASFKQECSILSVDISPDDRFLATGGCDGSARIWDIQNNKQLQRLPHDGAAQHDGTVQSVAFSPDGKYLATANWGFCARLWDVSNGTMVVAMTHESNVQKVAFSPDGKYLATGTTGNIAYLWSVPNGKMEFKMVHALEAHSVAFCPDTAQKYLASVSYDNSVVVWEYPIGRVANQITLNSPGIEAAFSRDSKYLAIGNSDYFGRVWDWKNRKEVARIVNNEGTVNRVAFSPDGHYLATAGYKKDDRVRLWELPYNDTIPTDKLEEEACSRLRRNLTKQEWKNIFGSERYCKTCAQLP